MQILYELELFTRQKNVMILTYKELKVRQDDSRVLKDISEVKRQLEKGYSLRTTGSSYQWSTEVKRIKDHFLLELNILGDLFKCKQAALAQDSLQTIMCLNNSTCYLRQRNRNFFDKSLKDVHNLHNNLWKWILNL